MVEKKLTSRQLRKIQTKKALVEAGETLLRNSSYEDISIEDITSRCNLSKGAFYVHFKSKEQFFYLICHSDYSQLVCYLEDESEPLYLERLRNYCKGWLLLNERLSIYYMQHWFSHMLDHEFHVSGTGDSAPHAKFQALLSENLRCAQENGELSLEAPIGAIVPCIQASLYGFDAYTVITEKNFDLKELASSMADAIVDGIVGRFRPQTTL